MERRLNNITSTGTMLDNLELYATTSTGNKVLKYRETSPIVKGAKAKRNAALLKQLGELLTYQGNVLADANIDDKTKRDILDALAKKYRYLSSYVKV